MKKALAALLCLMLLGGCLVNVALADPKEIDVMVWYRDVDDLYFNDMPYYNGENGITAQSGVKAIFNQVKESDWSTKLNLMFASGEYPDVILRGGVNTEMYGVDQGILLPLDDYIEMYMPVYSERLAQDPQLAMSLRSSDGKMYQIGWIVPQNINSASHLFINTNWLENLGLEMPTTIDEFTAVLRAFRDEDANGNGDPSDEIPFGGTYKSMVDGITHLFSFWGIPFNDLYLSIDDNGSVVSPLLADGLRDALEVVSDWYNEGLIDIESLTQDGNSSDAKVNAGDYGAFWRWRLTAMGTDEAVYSQYGLMVPVSADGYKATLPRYLEIPSFGAAVTVGAEDIESVMTWMDTQMQFDNMITGYNGAYGEFWDYDDAGKVVIFPMTDGTRTVPGQSSFHYMAGDAFFEKMNMPSHRIEKTSYCKIYEDEGVIEQNSWRILNQLVTLTIDESTLAELRVAEIQKYADEALTSFIVKGITDETWNTYLDTLKNIGLQEYIDLYQTVYDRYVESNN